MRWQQNTGHVADDKTNSKKGIVQGHAYTARLLQDTQWNHVIQAQPWGAEWTGVL